MSGIDNKTRGLLIEVAKTAIHEYDKHLLISAKKKVDNRLRNVKLLLKNYRNFKKHADEAKEDVPELMRALDLDELSDNSFQIRSILANRKKTIAMVLYTERMIESYRKMVVESGSSEDQRSYEVVHQLYLSNDKKTAEEIANGHNLNRRTVYKDVDRACKSLAVLMFGVDGVHFEPV